MIFPIFDDAPRREAATARHLNEVGDIISIARPSELRYIYGQLKAPSYLWKVASMAFEDRTREENRKVLRMVAFFWGAGIRPPAELAPWDAAGYLTKVAFLLAAHRGLLNEKLPIDGDRLWLFSRRKQTIRIYLETSHTELARSSFFFQCLEWLEEADAIVYCARHEASFSSTPKLAEYLERFCLLPEDIGITAEQLAGWRHQCLVQQAREQFGICRTYEFGGDTYDPNILDIYTNIYGVLLALTRGVSLEEAGITEDELRTAKLRLEQWLPDAIAEPFVHGVNSGGVISFNQRVMPMFDKVLPVGRGLHLVR